MEIRKHEAGAMHKMLTEEYPEIAKEWDCTVNGGLKPEDYASGSQYRVKWECQRGHRWTDSISNRTRGNGCPYCNYRRKLSPGFNDLLTVAPEVAMDWDYERNGDLRPENVKVTSHDIVSWRCRSGHRWKARISDRVRGAGCPYDSGKLLTYLKTDKRENEQYCDQNKPGVAEMPLP